MADLIDLHAHECFNNAYEMCHDCCMIPHYECIAKTNVIGVGIVQTYPLGSFPRTGLPSAIIYEGGDSSIASWQTQAK